MSLGFTGSREPMTIKALNTLCNFIETHEIEEGHHGDCVGADTAFHNLLVSKKIPTVIHPPLCSSQRAFNDGTKMMEPQPYLDRNRNIVNTSDFIIACPSGFTEVQRSGTWMTVRYARKTGKKVVIIFPDGSLQS